MVLRKKIVALIVLSFFLLLNLPAGLVAAATAKDVVEQPELTLEESITMALNHSRTLKNANLAIDLADESLDDAESAWRPSYATEYVDLSPSIETRYANLLSQEYNYDSAVSQRDIQKDAVKAEARSSYYDLLKAIDSLALKKTELEAQQISYKNSQVYYDVGMLSIIGLTQAKLALLQKQADYVAAENALNDSYTDFNYLVGLDINDRPILSTEPVMENLEIDNVAGQISLTMSNSPSLELVDAALELREELIWTSGGTTSSELAVSQAELNAATTKETVEKSLYSVYHSVKNLEESYMTAKNNLALAQQNLNIAKLKYDLGMNTKADVLAAEYSLLQAQNNLLSITCNHDILKETFYKPWAA